MSRTEKIVTAALLILAAIAFGVALLSGATVENAGYIAGVTVCGVLLYAWGIWAHYTGIVYAYEQADRERDGR